MPVMHVVTGLDPSLVWLFFLLLAFLLVSIVVGAIAGANVFDGGAPGPLGETRGARLAGEKAAVEKKPAE